MVGSNLELNMRVKVWNDGEDSYGTTVTFSYPPGLSYRRATVSQVLFLLGKQPTAGDQQRLLFKAQAGAAVAQRPLRNPGIWAEAGWRDMVVPSGACSCCAQLRASRFKDIRNECPPGC